MLASQLLRILQTIPSDVKFETRAHDLAEHDMTMKENQNAAHYDSKSFTREADSLAFESKDTYHLDGLRRETHPFVFEVKGGDKSWNPFMDEVSVDNQNGTRDSSEKEFQIGLVYNPISVDEDRNSLFKDRNAEAQVQNSADHECSMIVEELTHCKETEPRDSISPSTVASDTDANSYTDKNVLESPDIIVCYKEINYHVVKDICIDAGMTVNSKILIESSKDEQSGNSFPQPLNDNIHCEATEEAGNKELFVSDGLSASTLDNTEGVSANENESKEEIDGKFARERPKLSLESSFDKDTADCGVEDSMQKGGKTVTDASQEDSFVDRTLPIEEYGTRSFLRSFLNSLDGEGNKVQQPPDQQISSGKAVSEDLAASSAETGPKEDTQASNLYNNSRVDSRSTTSNFNSVSPAIAGSTNESTENVKDQSTGLGDVLDHKDTSDAKVHDQHPDHKDENSDDHSFDGQLSSKSVNPINSDGQAVEPHVLKYEHRDFDHDSVFIQGKYDEGETSFSGASFITHSGPIPFSGSISHRSDGSAASGRSFAFPVLQNEWNSSPVRMRKPDGKDYRKHKCWGSGILCCRF